jgi:hypothetical protein
MQPLDARWYLDRLSCICSHFVILFLSFLLVECGGGGGGNSHSVTFVQLNRNDTGIAANQCFQAASAVLVDCGSAGAVALNSAQDGMIGRDADVSTNSNTDGKLGFSFASVTGGCVQDNVTGLMWEIKTTDGGLRDWNKTYTNYIPAYNPYNLYGTAGDVSGYVNAVNSTNLCGHNDWRLPTAEELQSIVDYSVASPGPAVDTTWFPNTQGQNFWTASPGSGPAPCYGSCNAVVMNFSTGYVFLDGGDNGCDYYPPYPCNFVGGRADNYYVRLVRGGQLMID